MSAPNVWNVRQKNEDADTIAHGRYGWHYIKTLHERVPDRKVTIVALGLRDLLMHMHYRRDEIMSLDMVLKHHYQDPVEVVRDYHRDWLDSMRQIDDVVAWLQAVLS